MICKDNMLIVLIKMKEIGGSNVLDESSDLKKDQKFQPCWTFFLMSEETAKSLGGSSKLLEYYSCTITSFLYLRSILKTIARLTISVPMINSYAKLTQKPRISSNKSSSLCNDVVFQLLNL